MVNLYLIKSVPAHACSKRGFQMTHQFGTGTPQQLLSCLLLDTTAGFYPVAYVGTQPPGVRISHALFVSVLPLS